jgi:hypothetical protein
MVIVVYNSDMSVSDQRRKRIENASPAEKISDLADAAGFETMAGLYSFLRRHKAIIERKTVVSVKFPESR